MCRIQRIIIKKRKEKKIEWKIPAGASNLFIAPHYLNLCRFQWSRRQGLHTFNYMPAHWRPPGSSKADLGCSNDYSRLRGETTHSSQTAGVRMKSTSLWTARLIGNKCWLVLWVATIVQSVVRPRLGHLAATELQSEVVWTRKASAWGDGTCCQG